MEKVFFEYNENSIALYDALKNAEPPRDMDSDFNKFQKQIYSYTEFETKHFNKLQQFAEKEQLVNFICDLLKKVCPHYEDKEFYYILVLLTYSKEQKATEYLERLTEFAIANQLNLCHILITVFNEIHNPKLLCDKEKLEQYFSKLYMESEYFQFLKKVGIDASTMEFSKTGGEGYFRFDLTNMEGIKYEFQLGNEQDKRKFCKLSVSVFTPKGMKSCFDVSLSSEEFLLHHYHKDYYVSNIEEMRIFNKETKQEFHIKSSDNLLEIKEIIRQIEGVLQTKFSRQIIDSYFTKPLKGKKALQKWWETDSPLSI